MKRFYIVKEYFDYFMFENKLSKEEFCEECEIEVEEFNKLYHKNQTMNPFLLGKILKFTKIPYSVAVIDLSCPNRLQR